MSDTAKLEAIVKAINKKLAERIASGSSPLGKAFQKRYGLVKKVAE